MRKITIKGKVEKEYLKGKKLTIEVIFKIPRTSLLVSEEIFIDPKESAELIRETWEPLAKRLAEELFDALDSTLGILGIKAFKKLGKDFQLKLWEAQLELTKCSDFKEIIG